MGDLLGDFTGDGLVVYGESMPLGLESARLLALSCGEEGGIESLETLSNFAAMALTAVPADLTGVDRGTVPSVGCSGVCSGPRRPDWIVAELGTTVLLLVVTFLTHGSVFSECLCAAILPENARRGRD